MERWWNKLLPNLSLISSVLDLPAVLGEAPPPSLLAPPTSELAAGKVSICLWMCCLATPVSHFSFISFGLLGDKKGENNVHMLCLM